MRQKIIFDFDGTIVEASLHDYKVYSTTLFELKQQFLDFDTYWKLRRNHTPISEILACSTTHDVTEAYLKLRPEVYDEKLYQPLLTIIPGAREAIKYCAQTFDCYLVTARPNISVPYELCTKFDLIQYFVEGHAGDKLTDFKVLAPVLISVGDAEGDIDIAQKTGVENIVAVTTGIRTREKLAEHHPTHIIDSLFELPSFIERVQSKTVM